MRIEWKTTGKDIKKAVTFRSNCFIISGATRNRMFKFKILNYSTLISLEKSKDFQSFALPTELWHQRF